MNVKFDMLSLKNIAECTKLYMEVFNDAPWNDGWLEEDVKERLTDIFSNRKFLGVGVYDEGRNVIGFLAGNMERWVDSNHFHLNELCVETGLQNKGIGSQLLAQFEIKCSEHNISRIYLLTARAGQAETFYIKNGYYLNPKMVMMSKRLERN